MVPKKKITTYTVDIIMNDSSGFLLILAVDQNIELVLFPNRHDRKEIKEIWYKIHFPL